MRRPTPTETIRERFSKATNENLTFKEQDRIKYLRRLFGPYVLDIRKVSRRLVIMGRKDQDSPVSIPHDILESVASSSPGVRSLTFIDCGISGHLDALGLRRYFNGAEFRNCAIRDLILGGGDQLDKLSFIGCYNTGLQLFQLQDARTRYLTIHNCNFKSLTALNTKFQFASILNTRLQSPMFRNCFFNFGEFEVSCVNGIIADSTFCRTKLNNLRLYGTDLTRTHFPDTDLGVATYWGARCWSVSKVQTGGPLQITVYPDITDIGGTEYKNEEVLRDGFVPELDVQRINPPYWWATWGPAIKSLISATAREAVGAGADRGVYGKFFEIPY